MARCSVLRATRQARAALLIVSWAIAFLSRSASGPCCAVWCSWGILLWGLWRDVPSSGAGINQLDDLVITGMAQDRSAPGPLIYQRHSAFGAMNMAGSSVPQRAHTQG